MGIAHYWFQNAGNINVDCFKNSVFEVNDPSAAAFAAVNADKSRDFTMKGLKWNRLIIPITNDLHILHRQKIPWRLCQTIILNLLVTTNPTYV